MAEVHRDILPACSALHALVGGSDFLDCYSVASDLPVRKAAEIAMEFPLWAAWLLKLRNVIVAPLGLASTAPEGEDTIGIFPVVSESDSELVAGFNDKHLDFRIGVLTENGRIYFATWVHPHNIGGRLYLSTIMPFHVLIVRNALQRVASNGV